jgi:hypothetical protein
VRAASLAKRLASRRGLATIVMLVLVSAGLVAGGASPASAATGNIPPPLDIGTSSYVCQGYNYGTHMGDSLYGLDLTLPGGCSTGSNVSAGTHVLAPISGTLAYPYEAPHGNVCVNIAGGRSYTLTHIDLANGFSGSSGSSVTAGQWVGTVGAAGTDGNNGLAHLHFQIWAAPGCYNSSVIPFDSADSARICGAPDLPASGTVGSQGVWSGTSFTAADCSSGIDYRAAFQANTGYMFTQNWPGSPANTNQGMKASTNTAIAVLSTGVYEEVFQANTGNLYTFNSNGGGGSTGQPMMAGTSPAIAPWTINGDYRVAFQGSDGHLHTYDSYSGPLDTTKAMASGTSPAIGVVTTSPASYQMAYQGTNGDLWVYNSGGSGSDTGQPMASGTSPSIAPWVNGGSYRVAFQGSDGYLHYYDSYSGSGSTSKAMASGSSPVISRVTTSPTSYQMAYQGTNGDLWVLNSGGTGADTSQGMKEGTSPAIAPWVNGGSYRVAFQNNTGYLYYYDSYSGPGSTSQGMMAGTSPSIAARG